MMKQVDLDALRAAVSIHDVLWDAGYHYDRKRIPCPLHDGDNPQSFSIKADYFRCFVCGKTGDIFNLVQWLRGCDFPTAVAHITRLAHLDAAPHLTDGALEARKAARRQRQAAERERNRRLLACADAYRELTKMASRQDDPAVWERLDELYTARDHVENVEAGI